MVCFQISISCGAVLLIAVPMLITDLLGCAFNVNKNQLTCCVSFISLTLVYFVSHMAVLIFLGVSILIASELTQAINTKMDFGEEQESHIVTDSTKDNEDVEVQHTIVVSTKLKNNNRRLQNSRDDNVNSARTSNLKREDSEEVPVIKGYKAVETTHIFTPDTRVKLPANNFNARHDPLDENDIYPNLGINPVHFKPSNYYNNVNWWNQDNARNSNTFLPKNDRRSYLNQRTNINSGTSDDVVRNFYCNKCIELSRRQGFRGCEQLRINSRHETTAPNLKIDGKLAKLN